VLTSSCGFVRYRVGDVIECTRFLSRAPDLVALPDSPDPLPVVPLFVVSYRAGSLLSIAGEKTTEQHVYTALREASRAWNAQGLPVEVTEFTSYLQLDQSPPHYVLYFEVAITDAAVSADAAQCAQLLSTIDCDEIERQLLLANESYGSGRKAGKYGAARCVLVRLHTFKSFLTDVLVPSVGSATQTKMPRLLKSPEHREFFDARCHH
jgi:hypothetical protein